MFHSVFPIVDVRNPLQVWNDNPSYLLAEVGCFVAAGVGLWSALSQPQKFHRVLWLSALTGGASIELLTILETHIGNFYHSQATINLLGLREPLYMLLYYIFFQYASVSLAWQMKLSVWGEAAAATLIGSCLHQLVDQVGLAFLWWTWHNGEPLYTDRINGVPIASTFWVASTLFALAVVLRGVRAFASRHAPAKSSAVELSPLQVIAWSTIAGPMAALGVMNAPFLLLYHPLVTLGGVHAEVALQLFRLACCVLVVVELWVQRSRVSFEIPTPSALAATTFFFTVFLVSATFVFDPTTIVQTSFRQPFGSSCLENEPSFWGAFKRRAFVCNNTLSEQDHYDFHCVNEPGVAMIPLPGFVSGGLHHSWYTICGITLAAAEKAQAVLTGGVVLLVLFVVVSVSLRDRRPSCERIFKES